MQNVKTQRNGKCNGSVNVNMRNDDKRVF